MSDNEIVSTEPEVTPAPIEEAVVTDSPSPIDADEKYRRLQSYTARKEDTMIKSLVSVAKTNPDVLLDLAGETDEDKAFRNRVVKEATGGAHTTFESYEASTVEPNLVNSVVSAPPATPETEDIEKSLSILAISDERFQSEEGKAEFRKHYNVLNPSLPEADRIKIVMNTFLAKPAAGTNSTAPRPSSTPSLPVTPKEPTKEEKEAARIARQNAVRAKYAS